MTPHRFDFQHGNSSEVEAFLAERIHEFNENATGYKDGESFAATQQDRHGAIVAGISGYTWGGCCYITYLWVHDQMRGAGVGTALVKLAEHQARLRGCTVAIVASHSFQAPAFYEKLGYHGVAEVLHHPVGHSNLVFSKVLGDNGT